MTPLASLSVFGVRYRRGEGETVEALADVTFDIHPGKKLAIVGESGSGKSTLALALAGLLPDNALASGTIAWPGCDLPPANGRDIGFVFQDPGASLDPVMTIGTQIAEVAARHLGLTHRQAYAHAVEMIARVKLPDPARLAAAYSHQLSGGQKQRAAIAAAIVAKPALLIADEATSALDTIVQAEILGLIDALVAEDGMTLVLVSHDLALAANFAGQIAVFHRGRLVEIGEAPKIVSRPANTTTQALVGSLRALERTPPRRFPDAGTAP